MTTTNYWVGTTGESDNGANWSTGAAPGTDREDVYIQNFSSLNEWVVDDMHDASIDTLTLFGAVDLSVFTDTFGYVNILQDAELDIGFAGATTQVEVDGGNILNDGLIVIQAGSELSIGIGQENYNNSDVTLDDARTVLSGSGKVVLDGGTIDDGNSYSNLIVAGSTIAGYGSIGTAKTFEVIVDPKSLIQSQNGTLTIDVQGNTSGNGIYAGVFNTGTIEATSGSVIELESAIEAYDGDYAGSPGAFGTLEADDASTIYLSSFVSQQIMTTSGSGLFEVGDAAGDATSAALYEDIVRGTIAVEQNATLHFGNSGKYYYDGSVNLDNGIVYVGKTISIYGGNVVIDSNVQVIGDASGGGTGILNLSAGGAASTITAASSVTLTNGILIEGQGTIGDGNNLLLDNEGYGTIDANLTGTALYVALVDDEATAAATGTNEGVMEATNGGTLSIASADRADATFTNTGSIEAFAGSTVYMAQLQLTNIANATLTGGLWEASGNGASLDFDPDYVFTSDAATLILNGAGSFIGDGGDNAQDNSLESELTDIATGGALEVLGSRGYTTSNALTLEGALQLGGGTFASGAITGAAGSYLAGFGAVASAVTSAGTIYALGGTLTFTGADSFAGALTGPGGLVFSNDSVAFKKGASLAAQSVVLSSVTLSIGASLSYGAGVPTEPTSFTETTSTLYLSSGVAFTLMGATTLAGGRVTGAGMLNLKGTTTSSGFSVVGGASLVVGGSLDMTKALYLGTSSGTGELRIQSGGLLDLSGAASIAFGSGGTGIVSNSGTLEKADGGGIAKVSVAVSNYGTILAENGTLDFAAAVSGPGTVVVESAAAVEFDGSEANALSYGAGGGTLKLGSAASFKGAITGLGNSGTSITLAGFGTGTTETYTANSQNTGGTLKLVDGGKTTSLTLVGSYVASGFKVRNAGTTTSVTYASANTEIARPATMTAPSSANDAHVSDLAHALFDAAFAPAMTSDSFAQGAQLHGAQAMLAAFPEFAHR